MGTSDAFGLNMRLDLEIQGLRAACARFVSEHTLALNDRVDEALKAEVATFDLDSFIKREVSAAVRAEVKRAIEWRAREQVQGLLDQIDLEVAVRDAIRRESGA